MYICSVKTKVFCFGVFIFVAICGFAQPKFYKNLLPSQCGRFAIDFIQPNCSLMYFLSDTNKEPVRIQFNEGELQLSEAEYYQYHISEDTTKLIFRIYNKNILEEQLKEHQMIMDPEAAFVNKIEFGLLMYDN